MSSTTPTSSSLRHAMFGVFVIFGLNGIAVATWISRLPAIRDILGISVAEVGFLLFGLSAGAVSGLLAAAMVVHRLGARRTMVLTFVIGSLGLGLLAVSASLLVSFPLAIVAMVIFGVAWSICDVAMNVEGTQVEREMGRTLMPWYHASWSLGTVAGAGIGAVVAHLGIGPALHLAGVVIAVLITAALIPRLLPRELEADAAEGDEGAKGGFRAQVAAWREPRVLLIGVLVLGMAFAEGSANDWLALAMTDDRGFDDAQGALMFGVFAVAMTVGRIAGVPLLDRFGRVSVLRVAVAASAVGLAVVILVPFTPVMVAGIVVWGLGAALGFPVGMSAAGDNPVGAAARVSAVATIAYCAFLVGPPILGLVGEQIGILNSLWIVFALIVIAGFAVPAARKPALRTPAP
ncbi:MAG: MFS transporter [Pseudolysinimonas sp.]|uniref:MFS transporter n=1 Tax=Pseudolysinimonas sp. TaxID=2680009 RepID=UPI003C739180